MRIVRRLLLGLLGLVAALILLLAVSIVIDGISTAGRVGALTNTTAEATGRAPVRAYVARPVAPGPHAFVGDMAQVRAGGPQGEASAQLLRFFNAALKQGAAATGARHGGRAAPARVDIGYVIGLAMEHLFAHTHREH